MFTVFLTRLIFYFYVLCLKFLTTIKIVMCLITHTLLISFSDFDLIFLSPPLKKIIGWKQNKKLSKFYYSILCSSK